MTRKQYVVLTGTTIDRTNVFGPFTKEDAEEFKRQNDQQADKLWGIDNPIYPLFSATPKPNPAVVVKISGPRSWSAKVVTGK